MARRTRPNEMSGFFDLFRRKKKEPEQKSVYDVFAKPGSQLPALPPQPGGIIPAPKPETFSVIDVFRSKPQLPAKAEPGRREISLPSRPAAGPPPKKVEWGELIPPESPVEARPMSEVARTSFPSKESPIPKYMMLPATFPETAPKRKLELIVAPEQKVEWKLPTPEDLAGHFRRTFHDLDAMWNYIRENRARPEWKKDQLIASWQGSPMALPLDPVVYREEYSDFSKFYGIPWEVMEAYLNVPPEREREARDRVFADIISPLNAMAPEAFELLKPQDIPGFFNVSFIEPTGQYYLFYVEPLLGG